MAEIQKPIIGFSCGDLNGIGPELIIKVLGDSRILDLCTPVVFASNKVINFYKKALPEINFNYQAIRDYKFNPKVINVYTCWEEDVNITPGSLNEVGGKYAIKSLIAAVQALKEKVIDGLVTSPIHKKNVQSNDFNYTGHTPYLKAAFEAKDVVMILTAQNLKVALLSEHVPVSDIAKAVTKENILTKLEILNQSLKKDFGISKPRIAVLGLNPHAGDEGLVGTEEDTIIKPAIKEAKQKDMMVFGPYSADAFFARGQYEKFDAVLAMYHDQGLIPFKSLAIGEGVNFTAGLPAVRTSPDHGTAFDIAGKNKADESSMREAVFTAIDILRNKFDYADSRKNPLRKMSHIVLRGAEDEKIEQQQEGA
ncbi:MAG: 4-hydroxythreonine-4-phosphate dehydrogenase PdxA [Sphingobacteriales bacterium]|nr:4-hydroxythreonine-4-phosphate dehydrogenase PdxA [Sphingobacteriales bacterium]